MNKLETDFLVYVDNYHHDNSFKAVEKQRIKENDIRALRDIRKALYHCKVLVFWLKKKLFSTVREAY